MNRPKVLFLCYRNSIRSQVAEGFLRSLAGDRFDVYSAGIEPRKVHPLAVEAMAEIGIDISNQKSKHAKDFLSQHFGYIITVCDEANEKCPTFPDVSVRLHWSLEDPAKVEGSEEEKLLVFRKVRDQIKNKITEWLSQLETCG